jgi:hypothetical protein
MDLLRTVPAFIILFTATMSAWPETQEACACHAIAVDDGNGMVIHCAFISCSTNPNDGECDTWQQTSESFWCKCNKSGTLDWPNGCYCKSGYFYSPASGYQAQCTNMRCSFSCTPISQAALDEQGGGPVQACDCQHHGY